MLYCRQAFRVGPDDPRIALRGQLAVETEVDLDHGTLTGPYRGVCVWGSG